eukprot:2380668-Prymnesium_polylepis.1
MMPTPSPRKKKVWRCSVSFNSGGRRHCSVPSGQIGSSLGIPSPWATCVGHADPDDCDCCAAGRECCVGGG